jgi:type II secretory pathway component HofQ
VSSAEDDAEAAPLKMSKASAVSDQPRITVTYQDADIRDVIAAFAAFSGRTIVVGKDVQGTITAEIKNQPWDVALRAILQGQGLAAAEDAVSGIITVDSYKNIASKQASEPLITQMVAVNYAKASSLVVTPAAFRSQHRMRRRAASLAAQSQQIQQPIRFSLPRLLRVCLISWHM